MFDEKTRQELKFYVYMLVDPFDHKPFYIGKGIDNRVFNHLSFALIELENQDLKYDKIREIQNLNIEVKHVIIRHGLTEKDAFQIESSIIDSFTYCGVLLTNKVRGHNSIEKGLMTSGEIVRLYNATALNEISNDCILININRTYRRGDDNQSIYFATKETWIIKKHRLTGVKYVLSEYKGLIVEVFEVEKWYEKERGYGSGSRKFGQMRTGFGFNGRVADEEVRNKYINKSVAHTKKKGDRRSVRFAL